MNSNLFKILEQEPKYRQEQIFRAWFDNGLNSYDKITTLPKSLREKLKNEPWLSVKPKILSKSKIDDTQKVLLELSDGSLVETVLMGRQNKKQTRKADNRYTVCLSTQVGCPMGCVFCATGKLGFKRNLTAQEIIDEYRFWAKDYKISNIVLMGQGEPFLNYENVKQALNIILKYSGIGLRQITVSSVGVPDSLDKMLNDKDWPAVRFALSLHSAIEKDRRAIVPSTPKDFFVWLVNWSKKFHQRFSARNQFIGLEYTLVPGKNDDEKNLKALLNLAGKLGKVRINLIPLNNIVNQNFSNDDKKIKDWQKALMDKGFTTTIRRSQGQDIAAACGQLALKVKKQNAKSF